MPTTYAHYRFGCDVLKTMPPELRTIAETHRTLFDFGVHGPDLLFYHGPLKKNPVSDIGYASHDRTGRDFFTDAAQVLKSHSQSEKALAYLLGVLCHFTLDRESHPYVGQKEKTGASHYEIEASLDRYLLLKDGKDPMHHHFTAHLHPSEEAAAVIAPFYPPLGTKQVLKAQTSMVFYLNQLASPPGLKRSILLKGLDILKKDSIKGMFITQAQNPKCPDSDEALYRCYENALALSQVLIPDFYQHVIKNTPLGSGFDHTFGEE